MSKLHLTGEEAFEIAINESELPTGKSITKEQI